MSCACGCGLPTPIATRNRYDLGHVKGEPIPFARGHREGVQVGYAVEDRGYETPCWIWRGVKVKPGGYGRITRGRRKLLAHIFHWEAVNGPVPAGKTLDHLCRVPACVRPDHLEPVTHAENCRRGRATKLTIDDVRAIRASNESGPSIAPRYGIARSTVAAIRSRRLWAEVV